MIKLIAALVAAAFALGSIPAFAQVKKDSTVREEAREAKAKVKKAAKKAEKRAKKARDDMKKDDKK